MSLVSSYWLALVIQIAYYGIAALGLNILVGYTGQISLGHSAFFGFGAFMSAYLSGKHGVPVALSIPLAGIATGLLGVIVGLPAARLKGLYLAIATLASQFVLQDFFSRADWFTGGASGANAAPFSLFGLTLSGDRKYYYVVLFYLVIMYVFAANLVRTRDGRAMVAVRDHYLSAEIMGINLTYYRILAFGISSLYAGIGGALMAHYTSFVSAEAFDLLLSINFLAMIIIGGLGSVMGSLMGTVFILVLPEFMQGIVRFVQSLGFGQGSGFHRGPRLHERNGHRHGDRAVLDLRARRPGRPLAQDQGLLEALPVLVLKRSGKIRRRRTMELKLALLSAVAASALLASPALAQQKVKVGNLVDYTGATSSVGKISGPGKVDAFDWINANGGINGKQLDVETVDYGYQTQRSIQLYKKWKDDGAVAIQGYGTNDTEAMVGFIAEDKIPYFSLSFSGHLTDPSGISAKAKEGKIKPAPYNFFGAPSYSDGTRCARHLGGGGLEEEGRPGKAKYIHLGDNHPYPLAPKEAGEELAKQLGFDVVPSIQYALAGGDFKAQCLALQSSGCQLRVHGQHDWRQRRASALVRHGRRQRAVHGQHLGHGRGRHEGDRQGRRRSRLGGQPESRGARTCRA